MASRSERRRIRRQKLQSTGLFTPREISRRIDWSDSRINASIAGKYAAANRAFERAVEELKLEPDATEEIQYRKIRGSKLTRQTQFKAWSKSKNFPSDVQKEIDDYNDEVGLSIRGKDGKTNASYGYRRFYHRWVNGETTNRARVKAERGGS